MKVHLYFFLAHLATTALAAIEGNHTNQPLSNGTDNLVGMAATVEPSTVYTKGAKLRMFGDLKTDLDKNDYILVTLPKQVQVLFKMQTPQTGATEQQQSITNLTCVFNDPKDLKIEACESISSQVIKVTIGDKLSSHFQFDVLEAIDNPPSTTFTDSVIIQTFRGEDKTLLDQQGNNIFIAATNDTLSAAQMTGTVSQHAGDRNTLEFTIRTKNAVLPNGKIVVQFPYLFEVQQQNIRLSMVDATLKNPPKCIDLQTKAQTLCTFDSKTQTITLSQIIGATGRPAFTVIEFSIQNIFNPISTDVSPSIGISTTDSVGGYIDRASVNLKATMPNQIFNAKFFGDSSLVQESTKYTVQFQMGVPMYAGDCKVALYLPYPDFKITANSISDVQGVGLFGALRSFDFVVDPRDNSITLQDACSIYVLPASPATLYIYGLSNPEVAKNTDPIRINIWNEKYGEVAELTTDKSPTFKITTGQISNVSLITPTNQINSVVDFTLTFMFQHQALTDTLNLATSSLAQVTFTFTDFDFKINEFVRLKKTTIPGSSISLTFNSTINKITLNVKNPQIKSGVLYEVEFSSMQLANTKQVMTPVIIELSKQWVNEKTNQLTMYPIDTGSFDSLIETNEGEFLTVEILPKSLRVYDVTPYEFRLSIQNPIPQKGYILITIPKDLSIEGGSPLCKYEGKTTSCALDQTGQSIMITGLLIDKVINPDPDHSMLFEVTNMRNPRSLKTTGLFTFQSFDSKGLLIDYYLETNTAVTMSTQAVFSYASLTKISSYRVGDIDTMLTFDLKLAIALKQNDYLILKMPVSGEIPVPSFPLKVCSSPQQPGLQCSMNVDKSIKLKLSNSLLPIMTLTLNLQGFDNPPSGKKTKPFYISAFDQDDYSIAEIDTTSQAVNDSLSVQMREPYLITSGATIRTDTDVTTSPIVITIQFFIKHEVPENSKIVINYPSNMKPQVSDLSVTSPQTSSLEGVKVFSEKNQIVGEKFFSITKTGGSLIKIEITGFKNPTNSAPTEPFTIDIFTQEGQVLDRLQQPGLFIKSRCNYPCKDCSLGPDVCDSCLTSDLSTTLILLEEKKCVDVCRPGYYQVGNTCQKCDSSCKTCDISPLLCTSCPPENYLFNNRCVSACDTGYFRNDIDKICEQCKAPCQSCQFSINTCTTCKSGFYLYKGTCREQCPEDYFINNPTKWMCDRCVNECQTCQRTIDQCTSCKPGYKLNTLNSSCILGDCPANLTVEETPGICSACKPKCGSCSMNKTDYCLTCSKNLYLTPENDCVVSCKSNQAITKNINWLDVCVNCAPGCAKCLDGKPDVCQVCEDGLVNHQFSQCLTSCPEGFEVNNKSGNCLDVRKKCNYGYQLNKNDECELGVQECEPHYELSADLSKCIPIPGLYIPFPVIGAILLSTVILIIRVKCSERGKDHPRPTKLIPCIIILWSMFELPLFLLQAAFAAWYEHWFNTAMTMLAILLHFPVNYYSVKKILPQRLMKILKSENEKKIAVALDIQDLDYAFKHWGGDHLRYLIKLRRWSLFYNHKILRLLSCGYLAKPHYQAVFDRVDLRLHKPLLRATVANILLSYTLIFIADVTALKTLVLWGYQFTIFVIESLILTLGITILEIIEYYQGRAQNPEYFKVAAKNMSLSDLAFSADNEGGGAGGITELYKRQKSQEKHVALLKQLNHELWHRRIYSDNFEKLDEFYKNLNTQEKEHQLSLKQSSPQRVDHNRMNLSRNHFIEGYLSTQNHYGEFKRGFFEYEDDIDDDHVRDTLSENDLSRAHHAADVDDWIRPYNSLMSEEDYLETQRLNDFRDQFRQPERVLVEELPMTKTLDYKASFHILDTNPQGTDTEDEGGQSGMYLLQKPPRYNLTDVMGHFETDAKRNFIIVKRQLRGSNDKNVEYLMDALGRRVNRRGYLVDEVGNVVNKFGEIVVQRTNLDPRTDDIPAEIFKELFIPKQIARNQNYRSRRRAVTAGRRRKQTVHSLHQESATAGTKSRDTAQEARLKKNIKSEGEGISISDELGDAYRGGLESRTGRPESSHRFSSSSRRGILKNSMMRNSKNPASGGVLLSIDSGATGKGGMVETYEVTRIDEVTPAAGKLAKAKKNQNKPPKKKTSKGKKKQAKKSPHKMTNQATSTAQEGLPSEAIKVQDDLLPLDSSLELSKDSMMHKVDEDKSGVDYSKTQEKQELANMTAGIVPDSEMDALVKQVTKPRVAKERAQSQSTQRKPAYVAPMPKRKIPPQQRHNMLFDPSFYRIHLDYENELEGINLQGNTSVEPLNIQPRNNFLEETAKNRYHHDNSSMLSSLDQPPLSQSSFNPYQGAGKSSALNVSGRLVLKQPSQEVRVQLDDQSLLHYGKFYHPMALNNSNLISPAASMNQALIIHDGKRVITPSDSTGFLLNSRGKNNVTSAYAQDLTKLIKKKGGQAMTGRDDKKEDQDDPFKQLKKIFNK